MTRPVGGTDVTWEADTATNDEKGHHASHRSQATDHVGNVEAQLARRLLSSFRPFLLDSAHLHASGSSKTNRRHTLPAGSSRLTNRKLASALTAMTQQLLTLSARHLPLDSRFREQALQQLVSTLPLVQTIGTRRGTAPTHRGRTRNGMTAQIHALARKLLSITDALPGDREEDFDLTTELYHLTSVYDDFGHTKITLCLQPCA